MDDYIIKMDHLSKTYTVREKTDAPFFKRVLGKKQYRNVEALKDVTMTIKKGEFVGLVGNNGAGKSTLVKLMTGLLYPTDGTVEVLGRDPFTDRLKNNQEIGAVFGQRTQLNWDLSTIDSLQLLKRIYDIDDITFSSNIEMFCDLFGMRDYINRPVRTLSLGQRMQCELAAAFIHNPQMIFLDEPTIGLDVFNKDIIANFLDTIKKTSNATVILTTHDLEEMCRICDRIVVLSEGTILFEEDTDKLLSMHNQHKRLIFTTAEESCIPISWDRAINSSYSSHKIICDSVQREDIEYVISMVAKSSTIIDMKIEENSLTEIIKEYLKGNE